VSGLSEIAQTFFPDIVRTAPPEASRELLRAAGLLYYAFNSGERKTIERNIDDLLGAGSRAESVKRRVFGNIAEHYFEKLLVANRPLGFLRSFVAGRVACDGFGRLDAALARGKGVLAVTAHWGAVELIPPVLALRGYPISIVLETKTPRLRAALERAVAGTDARLLIASRGDRVLDRIFGDLAEGRVLVTQVDEADAWRRRRARTIRLFGNSLFFDHSLDFIAKRSGSPSVGLYCRRSEGLRYELRCDDIAPDPRVENVAEKALHLWERMLLESPEQWYEWRKWGLMKADPLALP
jgi:Kdo2-lipid IVA lauroyltransferase/acyltransferase